MSSFGSSQSAWFLAEVSGFKGKDQLYVKYLMDGYHEQVPRTICRVPNDRKPPFGDAWAIVDEFPQLKKIDSDYWAKHGEVDVSKDEEQVVRPQNKDGNSLQHAANMLWKANNYLLIFLDF